MASKKKHESVLDGISFEQVNDKCCGLDVHKKQIVATVRGVGFKEETRTYVSTTSSLTELREWLLSLGVTHVAMESTGVYWKPVYNILEPGGFTLLVVNAHSIKYVPGHKTDKKDSAWIAKLLQAGLLKGSFIPSREQRDLRDLTRYRRKLVQQESAEQNRLIRVLEDANLKLTSVFSSVNGKTCQKVINAILEGHTDPEYLASLCTHRRLKSSFKEIELAVEGQFTEHHKFMLQCIKRSIDNIEQEVAVLDAEINRRMQPYADAIARIAEIPGMGETSAKELLAEIGVNMDVFPTEKHLASWAGMCPGNNESAGKKKAHTRTTATRRRKR